ncbi:hypothetical protein MKX03_010794 [Papaver bracteatum]|nr:hypothetical protein MKX03_010794 [Papaver bracteatum]
MFVDMVGSENIEQAVQVGFEAKMQTAKKRKSGFCPESWVDFPID